MSLVRIHERIDDGHTEPIPFMEDMEYERAVQLLGLYAEAGGDLEAVEMVSVATGRLVSWVLPA